ncbi:hypothetical protein GOODEAATRI_021494 [Goodea atripinnis]|uniref:G-protein coupled receptors family 1 profile domain-containing protein n=1 Tax=Goodea atripinnis TaxID=208336 RepID=A0ABV0MJL3_9TELE
MPPSRWCSQMSRLRSDLTYMADMLSNTSFTWYGLDMVYQCSIFRVSIFISTSTNAVKILLLFPLSSFVLYHGLQKWQQQHSFKTASHSDIFTYHLAAMELIWVFGCCFFLAGIYTDNPVITTVGMSFCYIPFYGELVFNLLTCVERYLAVVHPLTYRGLKYYRGIRIRNITVGCAWLLCFGFTIMFRGLRLKHAVVIVFCFFVLSLLAILFCSISVLRILTRPGPREGGGDRVDRSRRRAFCTITVISSVVWLWFVGLLISHAMSQSVLVSDSVECLVMAGISWFGLPCSLVSPLLYLHKTGKLSFCCTQ